MRSTGICVVTGLVVALNCPAAPGWGAHGHRIITGLALEAAGQTLPAWATSPEAEARVAYQCNEPDRLRGVRLPALDDVNGPDHYIDVELLEHWGLSLETLPPLRTEYIAAMAVARKEHPRGVNPDEAPAELLAKDPGWPGTGLHAMVESYAKLVSSLNTVRILEAVGDQAREIELAQARANVIHHMGALSHFVGDLSQPLHTTIHHHGWIGENPRGYTRDRGIHAFIDSGVVRLHDITEDDVRKGLAPATIGNPRDPWRDGLAYVSRSYALVEPLYALHVSGELEREQGKEFIVLRLADAASMLGAMYRSAWTASEPTDEQVANFLRYDERPASTGDAPSAK